MNHWIRFAIILYISIALNACGDASSNSNVNHGPLFEKSNQSGGLGGHLIQVGDLDGDGDMDVVYLWYEPEVWLNEGDGDFTFSAQLSSPYSLNYFSNSIGLADLDGDHDLDVVVVGSSKVVSNVDGIENSIWINNGSGVFVLSDNHFGPNSNGICGYNASCVFGMDLGDVDSDGDIDIVTSEVSNTSIWLNDGAGQFSRSSYQVAPDIGSGTIKLFDVDNDGDLDALVRGQYDSKVYLNNGAGEFTGSNQLLSTGYYRKALVSDIDSDGDLDIILDTTTVPSIYFNDSHGDFTSGGIFPDHGNNAAGVAVGDFDVDGDNDVFIARGNQNLPFQDYLYLNSGSGSYIESSELFDVRNSIDVATADFDGDGDLDLFVTNNDSQGFSVWLNTTY